MNAKLDIPKHNGRKPLRAYLENEECDENACSELHGVGSLEIKVQNEVLVGPGLFIIPESRE